MIARVSALLALAAAVVPVTDARAETALSAVEAQRTMAQYADCLMARPQSAKKVRAVLNLPADAPSLNQTVAELAVPECMPRSFLSQRMAFQPKVLRSALYASAYRRLRERTQYGTFDAAPGLVLTSEFSAPLDRVPMDLRYARALGDCIVRASPVHSHALIYTKIGSADEHAAVVGLGPSLKGCVRAGNTMRLNIAALRGMVAEGLYKLVVAAPAAQRVN